MEKNIFKQVVGSEQSCIWEKGFLKFSRPEHRITKKKNRILKMKL